MRKFTVTSRNYPKFNVQSHTMTGAIAKAEAVGVKLYGADFTFTVKVAR